MTRSEPHEILPASPSLPTGAIVAATPAQIVAAFLEGRNERTQKAYRQDLEDFKAFLGQETVEAAAALLLSQDQGAANRLVLAYRQDLRKRKLKAATLNRRLAAIRSLVKLARMLGLVSFTLEIKNVKAAPYRDTKGPGKEGVDELHAALDHRTDAKGARDRALLHLLYDLALRTCEVCSLDLEHLDLKAGDLLVLGKGHEERVRLTLAPETKDALRAWLKFRGKDPGPLFVCLDSDADGERLSTSGLYRVVKKLGEKSGLRARPHGLRHAAITEALDKTGGDVRRVARFSRHKDVRVLMVYDDARKDLAGEITRIVAKRK